jgi:hypothetical protein
MLRPLTIGLVLLALAPLGLAALFWYAFNAPAWHARADAASDARMMATAYYDTFHQALADPDAHDFDAVARRVTNLVTHDHIAPVRSYRLTNGPRLEMDLTAAGVKRLNSEFFPDAAAVVCFRMSGLLGGREMRVSDIACPGNVTLTMYLPAQPRVVSFPTRR